MTDADDWKRRGLAPRVALGALFALVLIASFFLPVELLPRVSRSVRIAGVLSWYLLLLAAAAALLRALAPAARRLPVRSRALLFWAALAALWMGLFLSSLSWFSYALSGLFFNWEMVAFFVGNLALVLSYLTPFDWLAIAAAAVLATLVLWPARVAISRAAGSIAGRGAGGRLAFAGLASIGLAFSFLLFPAASQRRSSPLGPAQPTGVLEHSTPELAFLASAAERLRDLGGSLAVDQVLEPRSGVQRLGELAAELVQRGTDDYLERVDRERAKPLDVVVVVVEGLRADTLAMSGGRDLMPFVDSLASQGLAFRRAYAQGSETRYGLSSLLSSLYPLHGPSTNLFDQPLAPRVLLYEPLQAIGYRTGVFASSDEGWGNLASFYRSDTLDRFFDSRAWDGAKFPGDFIDDRVTEERLLSWLGEGPQEPPAFAYLMLTATHFPYELASEIETPFVPNQVAAASFLHYPEADCGAMRNRYWNSVRFIDQRIRELFAGVDQLGRSDRTLFVITGDHGEAFCEHGEITHGKNLYEEAVRVPLLLVGPPGLVPRRIEDRPVQHIDVAPTVLSLLGLPPHPNFQGADLLAPDPGPDDRKLFLSVQHLGFQDALVWRGLKLLQDSRGGGAELYDLAVDPGELDDLSARFPEKLAAYRSLLDQWRAAQMDYYGHRELQRRFYPPRYH